MTTPATAHSPFAGARLLVVKLGSAVLTTPDGNLDMKVIRDTADVMAEMVGAGRRVIREGGAYVANLRVPAEDAVLTRADLVHGRWLVLRRGRRHVAGVELSAATI